MNGTELLGVANRMRRERVDTADVLAAARENHGLERLEQIKYAIVERGGAIHIVPAERARTA